MYEGPHDIRKLKWLQFFKSYPSLASLNGPELTKANLKSTTIRDTSFKNAKLIGTIYYKLS
jgi:uncharacterized protein YjbI with pentapeptide repeats